jgi:hypothetical protein
MTRLKPVKNPKFAEPPEDREPSSGFAPAASNGGKALYASKMADLEKTLWKYSAIAFVVLMLCVGVVYRRNVWTTSLGLGLNALSFRVLVATLGQFENPTAHSIGISLLVSLTKLAVFGAAFFLLHRHGVNLLEVLGGFLAGQCCLIGAAAASGNAACLRKKS